MDEEILVMKRVKFLTDVPKRYARRDAQAPQIVVVIGKVYEIDEATLSDIPSERYELLDDVDEESVEDPEEKSSDGNDSNNDSNAWD